MMNEKELRALNHVVAFKENLALTHAGINLRLKEFREIYRGIFNPAMQGYVGKSQRFLREPIKGVGVVVANTIAALLPDPPIRFRGRGKEDIEIAELNQNLVLWEFDHVDFEERMEVLVEQAYWAGFTVGKIPFREDVRVVAAKRRESRLVKDENGNPLFDESGNPETETVEQETDETFTDYAGPSLEAVDLFNLYFNPKYTSPHVQGPGIAECYEVSLHDLLRKQEAGIYKNVDLLTKSKTGKEDISLDSYFEEETDIQQPGQFDAYETVKITEFWGLWDPDGDKKLRECLIVVANDTVVLSEGPNPFEHGKRPYIWGRIKESGDALGISLMEIISDDVYFLNDIVNQRVDNVTLVLNRMGKYKKGTVKAKDLKISAGHFIPYRDQSSDVEMFNFPDVTSSSYRESELATQQIRENLGANNPIAGIPSVNKTATEINRLTASANKVFLRTIRKLERMLVKPAGEFFYKINQQVVDDSITFRLGLGPLQTVTPADVNGRFDVIPTASTEMLSQADAGNMMQFLQTLGQTGGAGRWDMQGMEERIGKSLGIRDLEQLKLRPEQQPSPQPEAGAPIPSLTGTGAAIQANGAIQ